MNKVFYPLFFLMCLFIASTGTAQNSYKYFVVKQTDGKSYSLPAKNLKLTFENGTLTLKGENESRTFPLNTLLSMQFSNTPLSIHAATNNQMGLQAVIENDILSVMDDSRKQVRAVLFDAQGKRIKDFTLSNGCGTCSVAGLPAGTYILKVNEKNLKIKR